MALLQAMNRDTGESLSSVPISPEAIGIISLIVGIIFSGIMLYFLVGLLNEKTKYYKSLRKKQEAKK